MVNVFYNYYTTSNKLRNRELLYCWHQWLSNTAVDTIYAITGRNHFETNDKVVRVEASIQPTFRDFIELVNYYTKPDDINIFLNSDCFMKAADVELVKRNIKPGEVYCLTRWEVKYVLPFQADHYNKETSQDCWINVGRYPAIQCGRYKMGMPGCDSAIAYELNESGAIVRNPSNDIKVYHLHKSRVRTYGTTPDESEQNRVKREYLLVKPTGL